MSFRPFQTRYLGYWLVTLMLVAAGALNLATPLITALFSVFILRSLRFGRSKLLPAIIFLVLVLGFLYLAGFFIKQAVVALPRVAGDTLPKVVEYAKEKGITLPIGKLDGLDDKDELEQLKEQSITWLKSQLRYVGNFAKIATKEFAFLIIGLVVGVSLFFNAQIDLSRGEHSVRRNLYSFACDEIGLRFRSFYHSFARVMGAQLIISTINTGFTAVYVVSIELPYGALAIALTWVCGVLPIIGNLISNTVIVALSFGVSPQLAMGSLVYLVVIHKLEYFLNSKIIGDRIKNPVWLTLVGLVLGERLMGLPGMVLAPVILDFIKNEASTIEMSATSERDDEVRELEHSV